MQEKKENFTDNAESFFFGGAVLWLTYSKGWGTSRIEWNTTGGSETPWDTSKTFLLFTQMLVPLRSQKMPITIIPEVIKQLQGHDLENTQSYNTWLYPSCNMPSWQLMSAEGHCSKSEEPPVYTYKKGLAER